MSKFFLNVGGNPVRARSTIDGAYRNMAEILKEAGLPEAYRRDVEAREDDGRFAFLVVVNGRDVSVRMPGVPFEELKDEIGFPPRIYVDGNSWWWRFAVSVIKGYG